MDTVTAPLSPEFSQSDTLGGLKGIGHGFFGRAGGVSRGLYDSLNCSYSAADDPASVRENRSRVSRALGGGRLVTNRQVHGDRVRVVGADTDPDELVEADGLVTTAPGICLGALGADCAPVLLAAPGVVGAAHAGWQGALAGITDAVIGEMQGLGARVDAIHAAIGPAIQSSNYEVGDAFREHFLQASGGEFAGCFHVNSLSGNVHFDLPGYIEQRLRRAGVVSIWRSRGDTYGEEARYFSYRRACHRGETDYGRQVGAICLSTVPG